MNQQKYVIVQNMFSDCPIVFSNLQNHSDFKCMGTIIGAGFVHIGESECKVYGCSTSLAIHSKVEDEWYLNRLFFS